MAVALWLCDYGCVAMTVWLLQHCCLAMTMWLWVYGYGAMTDGYLYVSMVVWLRLCLGFICDGVRIESHLFLVSFLSQH